ncbi:hypothetical protein CYY_005688 [Polysphondylium violaceum]|uniref:Anaphase-promoting complex subunit CDC26 n=1 Tax=Polysphondylium violaceum TaxID=133409 RepID=A0A8J4PTV2_9MYCE|nr:hypothetical protein CYY_005688 [Polysphondylium violaceum]
MITKKPTRIEITLDDLEEYQKLKDEQTTLKKKQQNRNNNTNTPSNSSSNTTTDQSPYPLANSVKPPKQTSEKRIGYDFD